MSCGCATRLEYMLDAWGLRRRQHMWYVASAPVLPDFIKRRHTTAALLICWQALRQRGARRTVLVVYGVRGLWQWWLKRTRPGQWLTNFAKGGQHDKRQPV